MLKRGQLIWLESAGRWHVAAVMSYTTEVKQVFEHAPKPIQELMEPFLAKGAPALAVLSIAARVPLLMIQTDAENWSSLSGEYVKFEPIYRHGDAMNC